jgi:DNA invertase Pin-like site-specific DNA recombinase
MPKFIDNKGVNRAMRIVEVFEEKAVPGKTEWNHRPAWMRIMSKIISNGVCTILIERLGPLGS